MGIFSRKKREDLQISPPLASRVEVELDKAASAEAHEKAKETSQHLNDLLIANGFTLKIFLAAGGHLTNKSENESRTK